MRRFCLLLVSIVLVLSMKSVMTGMDAVSAERKPSGKATVARQVSCKGCHTELASMLPKNHPEVKGSTLAECVSCHSPNVSVKSEKNAFSTRMHLGHVGGKGKPECTTCHVWVPGKSFGLIGVKGSWGAPDREDMKLMKEAFASWSKPGYLDNLHAKASVGCAGCHGRDLAKADAEVENKKCLDCHGPMEALAKKTEPKDTPDRNPHKSHLGEIACTVCHKAHAASKVYCLDCHKGFGIKIQGAGE